MRAYIYRGGADSQNVTQTNLKLTALLPQPHKCWTPGACHNAQASFVCLNTMG